MALHGSSHSVMGSLDVRVACVCELFIAIARNVCYSLRSRLKSWAGDRDSHPTTRKPRVAGAPASESLDADTCSRSVPKLTATSHLGR